MSSTKEFDSLPTIDESTPGFILNPKADALIKHAVKLKNEGKLNEAVEILEAAENAILEGKTKYRVDTHCKLPLYLQQAGRGEEAVQNLLSLLDRYPPSWGKELSRDRVGLFEGHIERQRGMVYDKLRLVLQREGRFDEALIYAVLAETYRRRIDNRIYQYVSHKWEGKTKPPEPDFRLPEAEYQSTSFDNCEWNELQSLKRQYTNISEIPELKSVKVLLKKLKKANLIQKFQHYSRNLINDFNKSDKQAISEAI